MSTIQSSPYCLHQWGINHIWQISQGCTTINDCPSPLIGLEDVCWNIKNSLTNLNVLKIDIVVLPVIKTNPYIIIRKTSNFQTKNNLNT